jgi:hypothetical protein
MAKNSKGKYVARLKRPLEEIIIKKPVINSGCQSK